MSNPARHVLFLHVPKTAGVSIEQLIRDAVPAERINPAHPAHVIEDTDWSRAESYEYFFSHVPLYLRDVLPQPLVTFTFLREPTARAVSAYNHMLRAPGSPWFDIITTGKLRFTEALDHPELALWLCDVTTRLLGAEADLRGAYPDGKAMYEQHEAAWHAMADDSTLGRALDCLERIEFIGLTEEFDRAAAALTRFLGLRRPVGALPFENAAPADHPFPELVAAPTPEAERAMRAHSPRDFEVYEHGKAIAAARRRVAA